MPNAYDYIGWRGDLSFDRDPVNEVDMLLFSQLAAPDYTEFLTPGTEMKLEEVSKRYFETHTEDRKNLGLLQSDQVLPMLKAMGESVRFKEMILTAQEDDLDTKLTEQFNALTLMPSKDLIIISCRGTDDTLVGWKEDMYLAIYDEVPAQKDALNYLIRMAERYPDARIRLVGHSKGGNLAIYAAVHAPEEIAARIERVVGFDSPGFQDSFFTTESYLRMKDRIFTVLTQNSIVGVAMRPAGKRVLCRSNVSGPVAHDPFTWDVMGKHFTREKRFSRFSTGFSAALYNTLKDMDTEQKKAFVDEIFAILESFGAKTVTELAEQKLKFKTDTLKQLIRSPEVKSFSGELLRQAGQTGHLMVAGQLTGRKNVRSAR